MLSAVGHIIVSISIKCHTLRTLHVTGNKEYIQLCRNTKLISLLHGLCNADQQQQSKPIIASFELCCALCVQWVRLVAPRCAIMSHYQSAVVHTHWRAAIVIGASEEPFIAAVKHLTNLLILHKHHHCMLCVYTFAPYTFCLSPNHYFVPIME